MRFNWKSIFPILMVVLSSSCFDKAPVYSSVPSIEFSDICFKVAYSIDDSDSLKLTIKFKDGDGDLGLSANNQSDNDVPYNEKYYFLKKADGTLSKVTQNNLTSLLSYKDKRTNAKYASLPDFVTPYNCTNWEITYTSDKNPKPTDTLYVEFNPNHFNILIDFYTKNNDGSFTLFDWSKFYPYPNCSINGYNGRFPVLSNDVSKKSALEGILKYSMLGSGFTQIFSIKTLKLKITVIDRALNKSNLLETPEFNLQSIKCN